MGQRAQFLWGSGAILLWLLTFLFLVGNYRDASSLSMAKLARWPFQGSDGLVYWNSNFAPDMAVADALDAVGCTNLTSSPLCTCLTQSVQVARSQCVQKGRATMTNCFATARGVQRVEVRDDAVRPYLNLLSMNLWAALVGTVLLVRGKLADKSSYSVQLLFQSVILTLTVGAMWLSLGAQPSEWVTMLVVSIVIMIMSRAAEDDQSWVAFHFHLVYSGVLPTIWVVFNAYDNRLDMVYFFTTVTLALALALVAACRMLVENVDAARQNGVANWCNAINGVLGMILITSAFDSLMERAGSPALLNSASYSRIVAVTYTTLSLHPMSGAGQTLFMELLLRSALTVVMIKELFP